MFDSVGRFAVFPKRYSLIVPAIGYRAYRIEWFPYRRDIGWIWYPMGNGHPPLFCDEIGVGHKFGHENGMRRLLCFVSRDVWNMSHISVICSAANDERAGVLTIY